MQMLDVAVWSSFLAFVLGLLALDLGVFHRETRAIRTGEALAWAGFYVALALLDYGGSEIAAGQIAVRVP